VKISASVIVFNEEENISELCESLAWADEIVIVDSSSSDRTVELVSKYTDKVFQHEFKGYKDKHEFADSKTSGDWIFWIDADERVTPELSAAIDKLKARPLDQAQRVVSRLSDAALPEIEKLLGRCLSARDGSC